jgi:FtsP/CotA-like multicopper oxidase with cupredoxin domain
MNLNRRDLIKLGVSASGVLLLPLQFPKKALADDTSTPKEWEDFTKPLCIPSVLQPYKREDKSKGGMDYYQIVMGHQEREFTRFDEEKTQFWGYNSMFPGPTIRQELNRPATVDFVNDLGKAKLVNNQGMVVKNPQQRVKAVVHLHGMASLPQYDGFAEDYIEVNQHKEYIYPNDRAASLWYHDHQVARTKRNVAMGLAGMWIVYNDELEKRMKLPQGKYDVPLIFQRPPFIWKDSRPNMSDDDKKQNPLTLINGGYQPLMDVKQCYYRFRLLNATATDIYKLKLLSYDPIGKEFVQKKITVIGTDSGLTDYPVKTEILNFAMGERYEILINFNDYKPGNKIALVNEKEVPSKSGSSQTKTKDVPLLCFRVVEGSETDSITAPPNFEFIEYRPLDDKVKDPNYPPDFVFAFKDNGEHTCSGLKNDANAINGRVWNADEIQAYPEFDKWQKWRLINLSNADHPIHIHLLDFQMVRRSDIDGREKEIFPYEQPWKDIFNLKAGEILDIVGHFGPHLGRYMIHCHNLNHEDCDMMTQFEVVLEEVIEYSKKAPSYGAELKDPKKEEELWVLWCRAKNKIKKLNLNLEDDNLEFWKLFVKTDTKEKTITSEQLEALSQKEPIEVQQLQDLLKKEKPEPIELQQLEDIKKALRKDWFPPNGVGQFYLIGYDPCFKKAANLPENYTFYPQVYDQPEPYKYY